MKGIGQQSRVTIIVCRLTRSAVLTNHLQLLAIVTVLVFYFEIKF